jgi:choline dehydrogenase
MPAQMRNGWEIVRGELDWGYTSQPDEAIGVLPVRRNKVVGGTSWLTRFTPRGAPADYDAWAAGGNQGWSWDEVLPYFIRLESDLDFGADTWHGASGPMPSNRYLDRRHAQVVETAVEALIASGFPEVADHNRPGAVGVGRMPMSARSGVRVTTADAYLPLEVTPPNLTVRGDAQVDAVTFDGTRATGVQMLDGSRIEAGWIVLCAGTYGSPSVLLRSGIGPAEHLRAVGVPIRVDLPGVGSNLADHPQVEIDCAYEGSLAGQQVLHSIATFHSSSQSHEDPPDLMFWIADPSGDPPHFTIELLLLKPRSRGSVRLRSADPADAPLIFLPSLEEPTDVERLAEGLSRARELMARPDIQRFCVSGSLEREPSTRREVEQWIRNHRYSIPHVVGTCAMGTRPDNGAVVDSEGRVHGAERLSVVDASIMPDVPSGFTHFPTIMIAERLSERLVAFV